MSSTTCDNHTCTEIIDVDKIDHVICPLCRDATYCSEQCRMIDWPAHACPNAIRVDQLGTNMAVPYFYEDMLPAAELEAELRDEKSPLNATYLLYHTGADMQVTQWTQQLVGAEAFKVQNGFGANLGRGGAPPPDLENQTFTFNLYQDGKKLVSLAGTIGRRAIHAESEDDTIKAMANAFFQQFFGKKASTSLVLWPDMKGQSGIFLPPQGRLVAELVVLGKSHTIEFNYTGLTYKRKGLLGALGKRFQQRLKLKFPGRDEGIKNMQTITAWAKDEGSRVNLTFSVLPGMDRVELKDVEFLIPYSVIRETPEEAKQRAENALKKAFEDYPVEEPKYMAESMYADPLNVDSMMGLTMALEYASTQIKADLLPPLASQAAFDQAASIVRKHTRSMLDGKQYEVAPMEVNAAVYTAVNALYELQQVEISISKDNVKKLVDKMAREGRPPAAEAYAVKELIKIRDDLDEIRKAEEARPRKGVKSFFKRKIDTAKKSRLDKQLDEWTIAIQNYLNTQPEGTRFAQADAIIRQAKRPSASASAISSDEEK